MNESVVITGTGLVCALGQSPDDVWSALLAGKTGTRPLDNLAAEGFPLAMGAPALLDRHPIAGVAPKLAELMEKHLPMMLHGARQAFQQSHPAGPSTLPEQIGWYAGMGMVDYGVADLLPAVLKSRDASGNLDLDQFYAAGYQEIYPLWPLAMLNNVAFCQVAISLDLRGESAVLSPHADAGILALAEAVGALQARTIELTLAGGVSETLSSLSITRARLAGLLNPAPDADPRPCRPFAADRRGTVLGEGCGLVVLERETDALARGARPMARITGFGFACGSTNNAPEPRDHALAAAMRQALANAGITPADVDVLIAHGDGTLAGDSAEMEEIHLVFADRLPSLPVFLSKGALGHLLAASPAVDLILATRMLQHQLIPPCPSAFPLDSQARFVIAPDQPLPAKIGKVLINACSHEGPCAAMVVEV